MKYSIIKKEKYGFKIDYIVYKSVREKNFRNRLGAGSSKTGKTGVKHEKTRRSVFINAV